MFKPNSALISTFSSILMFALKFARLSLCIAILPLYAITISISSSTAMANAQYSLLQRGSVISELNVWEQIIVANPKISAWEKDTSRDWIGRLRSRFELRSYSANEDLIKAVDEIVIAESSPQRRPHSNILKFAQNLKLVFQTVREKTDDPLMMMKSYASFGSISNPADIEEFAASREYFNLSTAEAANDYDPDRLDLFFEINEPDDEFSDESNSAFLDSENSNAATSEVEILDDGLRAREFDETLNSKLTTETGALDSTEGDSNIRSNEVIPSNDPALKL